MSESRRTVLKSILVGAAATTFPAVALGSPLPGPSADQAGTTPAPAGPPTQTAGAAAPNPNAPPVDAPWALIAPATAGTKLALGWMVESLSPVTNGAPILGLKRKNGDKARVYVCRSSEAPVGVAQTKWLDFVLVNGGNGKRVTDESLGRVLLGLAATIRQREEAQALPSPTLAKLKTNQKRLEQMFGIPA